MHDVHATLSNLSSSISSEAFNALHGRWEAKGRKALFNLWNTLMDLQIAFGRVLTEIYEWKAKLVVAVGLADMGLTFAYVASGGAAALASHVEGHVVRSEVARRLQHLLDELEAKIVTVAIQGTPLHAAEDLIARELQALLDAAITDSAHTAGSKAGG